LVFFRSLIKILIRRSRYEKLPFALNYSLGYLLDDDSNADLLSLVDALQEEEEGVTEVDNEASAPFDVDNNADLLSLVDALQEEEGVTEVENEASAPFDVDNNADLLSLVDALQEEEEGVTEAENEASAPLDDVPSGKFWLDRTNLGHSIATA